MRLGCGAGSASYLLCTLLFCCNAVALVLQLVHSTMTRHISVWRLMLGINVVALSAAAIYRAHLNAKTFWEIIAGVPLISWYLFWSRQALAPPRAGEALRPAKDLAACHPLSKAGVFLVSRPIAADPRRGASERHRALERVGVHGGLRAGLQAAP